MTNVTQMNETDRQYYFMEKASGHVAKLGEELGRRPTCCVTTFGCQMNARDSEKLVGILEKVGYEIRTRSWKICRWRESILSNQVSILCSAAIISAAIVLSPMSAAESEAVIRRISSGR